MNTIRKTIYTVGPINNNRADLILDTLANDGSELFVLH